MDYYTPIGFAVMRDPVTGNPAKETIPIYAKSKTPPTISGLTKSEEKVLTDVSGVFVDVFRCYANELKKVKNTEKAEEKGALQK